MQPLRYWYLYESDKSCDSTKVATRLTVDHSSQINQEETYIRRWPGMRRQYLTHPRSQWTIYQQEPYYGARVTLKDIHSKDQVDIPSLCSFRIKEYHFSGTQKGGHQWSLFENWVEMSWGDDFFKLVMPHQETLTHVTGLQRLESPKFSGVTSKGGRSFCSTYEYLRHFSSRMGCIDEVKPVTQNLILLSQRLLRQLCDPSFPHRSDHE